MKEQTQTLTIESKIYADAAMSLCLEDIAAYYGYIERTLFNDLVNAEVIDNEFVNKLKSGYQVKYNITARQYNAIFSEVKGKIASLKELYNVDVKRITKAMTAIKKKIAKHSKIIKKGSKKPKKSKDGKLVRMSEVKPHDVLRSKDIVSQLKQKLNRLKQQKEKAFKESIVFGTRDFYKKQWMDDKYVNDHDMWLQEWRRRRNGHFYSIGSSDEKNGNVSCQYVVGSSGGYLQLRLPNSMVEKYNGKYVHVPVKFHSDRGDEGYYEYFHEARENKTALSYRFLLKENGEWYVRATFTIKREIHPSFNGCIGVDINCGLIATTEANRHGNYVGMKNYLYNPEGMSTDQKVDMLSLFVKDIVSRAKVSNRSVSLEDIDLEGKKHGSSGSKKYNYKINMLEYGMIRYLIISRCVKEGVYYKIVNPAYTSVIGFYKYSKFYGIGVHNAAALVIARRLMRYKEKVPIQMASVLHRGEESKWETICRHKHHWSHWRFLKDNLKDCLKQFNSSNGCGDDEQSERAITVNMLKLRLNPGEMSFALGCREECFSI